ncbi:hypothetical protein CYMTET_8105, partial [Cymbomonas tetramitiformis]
CGGVVDGFGYHYLARKRMGIFTYRHDAVQDVLVEMLRKVPFAVETSGGSGGDGLQFLKTRHSLRRPDVDREKKSEDS